MPPQKNPRVSKSPPLPLVLVERCARLENFRMSPYSERPKLPLP